MKYRIVIKTELSGKKQYYIQQRFIFYFWIYLSEITNMSMSSRQISFSSLKEAKDYMQHNIDYDYRKQQSKIVKKEIYKK